MHDHTAIPMCRWKCHNDAQHPYTLKGKFEGWTAEQYFAWHRAMAARFLAEWKAEHPPKPMKISRVVHEGKGPTPVTESHDPCVPMPGPGEAF